MIQKTLTTTFEANFIQRTLRTTAVLLLIVFLFGIYYFGFYNALAVLSAGIWSMINLIFLSILIRNAMRPDEIDKMAVIVTAIIKFPLLYAAGYFLLTVEVFSPIPLVIGFTLVFVVIFLKALARVIFKLDYKGEESDSRGIA
jgi:hypothetical protein